MPKEYHTWTARLKCTCGYTWTTPGSVDVMCKCGQSGISNNTPFGTQLTIDENEFAAAVAADIGVDVVDLVLIQE